MKRSAYVFACALLCAGQALATQGGPDFNDDGFDDLAIGVPGESISGKSAAGAVHIIYGSEDGLTSAGDQLWHQNQSGAAGSAENGDRFGSALAWGDFDGDGFDDLAVACDREGVSGNSDAGSVHVFYGSASGLTASGDQIWSQASSGIADTPQALDRFGYALATGDFNGDGIHDLAIGAPGEDFNGISAAGVVQVIYGSVSGLSQASDQRFHQDSPGISDFAETADQFGSAVESGDFDGDGFDDLAIAVPFENNEGAANAGIVHILYGSAEGVTVNGSEIVSQDDSSDVEQPETNDQFGSALASGDLNDDGFDDLAVGAPLENVGVINNAGLVHVYYGHDGGLEDEPEEVWTQNSNGISDSAEFGDWFGASMVSGDFDGDGIDDLAIGAPLEDISGWINAGAVSVLLGSAAGLDAVDDEFIHQGSSGVPSAPRPDDAFGASLASGDYNGDGAMDLSIGIPGEQVSFKDTAGAVNVGYGRSEGFVGGVHQFWHQDSGGIADGPSVGDNFGAALRAPLPNIEGLLPPL